MLLALARWLDRFSDLMGWIAGFLNLVMLVNVFYDAIMRYFFNTGSIALQELEWHLFSIVFLFGMAYRRGKRFQAASIVALVAVGWAMSAVRLRMEDSAAARRPAPTKKPTRLREESGLRGVPLWRSARYVPAAPPSPCRRFGPVRAQHMHPQQVIRAQRQAVDRIGRARGRGNVQKTSHAGCETPSV